MITTTIQVNDMTCGQCVSNTPKALMAVDREAEVDMRQSVNRPGGCGCGRG